MGGAIATDADAAEEARVQEWQQQRLGRLGYRPETASRVVRAAWMDGEHTDLVHRIEDLVHRGATLDQAARIVVSVRMDVEDPAMTDVEEPAMHGGGHDAG